MQQKRKVNVRLSGCFVNKQTNKQQNPITALGLFNEMRLLLQLTGSVQCVSTEENH